MGQDDNETEVIILNKLFKSAAALLTSLSIFVGAVPLYSVAEELSAVTGVLDTSDISVSFGEYQDLQLTFDFPDIQAGADSDAPYYLGDYLDTNNKAVYEKLAELVTPSVDTFTVTLPKTVQFTSSTLEISNDTDFYNAVFSSCVSAMEAASFDLPLLFWMDNNHTSVSTNSIKYSYSPMSKKYTFTVSELTITPAAYENFASFDEILEYKDTLEAAIADFPVEGKTREEQLRSIHDYICSFTNYDLEGKFSGSALSSLVVPGAVCEGYSKGFKAICDSIGIPCVCIFGNYDETKSTAHMWNYVRMEDGYWYAIDVTWDDSDGKYGVEFDDRFFLKGSDEFFVQHNECSEFLLASLTYPEIASWNYGENAGTTTSTSTTVTSYPSQSTTITQTASAVTSASTVKTSTAVTSSTTSTTSTTKTTTTKTSSVTNSTVTTEGTSASAATTATTTAPPEEILYGDVNLDGNVNIADLVYCVLHVLGSEDAPNNCDLNGDGVSDAYDVVLMRRIIVDIMINAVRNGKQT